MNRWIWKKRVWWVPVFSLALLGGCQQAGRLEWTAGSRRLAGLSWPAGWAPAGPGGTAEQQGLSAYLSGLLADGQGQTEQACRFYQQAHEQDPVSPQILIRLGTTQLRLDRVSDATETFLRVSHLDPTDSRPHFLLGMLLAQQGRLEEAAEEYGQVLIQEPGDLAALSQLADLYILQEKIQEAIAAYEHLLKERPDSSVAHFNAGVLCAKVGAMEQAIFHMEKAAELDPGYLEAWLGLGICREVSGDLPGAKQGFLKALELEPANLQLIHYLSRLCTQMENLEEAADWLGRYLSFQPKESWAHLDLAYLRIAQGRWEEAVRQLELALRLGSDEEQEPGQIWEALGLAYQAGGRLEKAEEAYRQSVAAAPLELAGYLRLGVLYHRGKRYGDAEEILLAAYALQPTHPEVLNSLGYLYADWGIHLDRAEGLIQGALSQDPENGAYLDSLGWIYYRRGQLEEARHLLEEAAEKEADPEVFEHLGQVYLDSGEEGKAETIWQRALGLAPEDPEAAERIEALLKALRQKPNKQKER